MTLKPLNSGVIFYTLGQKWHHYYGTDPDWLGMIPLIILNTDPRPVREQVKERYNGGGWNPFAGFKIQVGADGRDVLVYPGDPPQRLLCECDHINGERVQLFESAWVRVIQQDGSFEISRMD